MGTDSCSQPCSEELSGPGQAMHVLAALWRRWERGHSVRESEGTRLVTVPASWLGPGSSQHQRGRVSSGLGAPGKGGRAYLATLLGAQRHSVIPEGDYSQMQVQNHPEPIAIC